jgi:hypothetical protein
VTGRRAELVGLALVVVVVLAGTWWYRNEATFGDPPREIHFEGCTYRPTGSLTTMHQAEIAEHTPIVYRTTHFGQLGSTWARRAFYGLEIGPGCPTNAPLDIYLQGPASGQLELYMRSGGP